MVWVTNLICALNVWVIRAKSSGLLKAKLNFDEIASSNLHEQIATELLIADQSSFCPLSLLGFSYG